MYSLFNNARINLLGYLHGCYYDMHCNCSYRNLQLMIAEATREKIETIEKLQKQLSEKTGRISELKSNEARLFSELEAARSQLNG